MNYGTTGETDVTNGEFDQRILTQKLRLNYDTGRLKRLVPNAGPSDPYGAALGLSVAATRRRDFWLAIGLLRTAFEDFTFGGIDDSGEPYFVARYATVGLSAD